MALPEAIFVTSMTFVGIMGARYIIREFFSKAYCRCGHEYNEHNIVPKSRGYAEKEYSNEACRVCSCRKWAKNEKDKRNTPPVRFW